MSSFSLEGADAFESQLELLDRDPCSSGLLYRDRRDGSLWELLYPASEDGFSDASPELQPVCDSDVALRYPKMTALG